MRIGFIADFLYKPPTGIANYAYGIIAAFRKYYPQFKYYYFVPYGFKLKYPNFKLGKNEEIIIPIRSKLVSKKNFLWYSLLPYFIKKYNLDYIFNFTGSPHFSQFYQKEIFVVHDLSLILFPHFHRWQSVLLNKIFFKKNLLHAYKILVNSEFTKKELIQFFPTLKNKIFVIFIPHIPYVEVKEKKFSCPKPFILNINTIEPRKNILNLITAFKLLKKEKKIPHYLIIVGEKGWKYKKILKKISLSPENIILTGYLSENKKKYLIKNADVFVYPSFYEGFGIPVLEAMYYGCPIITSNTSSLPEITGSAGLLINPQNVSDLANAIYKVITNINLRKRLIKKGRIQAKKYMNGNNIKKKINELFNFLQKQ